MLVVDVLVVDVDIGMLLESVDIVEDESIFIELESVVMVVDAESPDMVAVFSVVLLVEQDVAKAKIDSATKADFVIAFIIRMYFWVK